jgi:hypothetical protein
MAWWDHEELKAPADRSDRYVLAFYVHDHYLDIEGYAHLIVERTEDGVGMKKG